MLDKCKKGNKIAAERMQFIARINTYFIFSPQILALCAMMADSSMYGSTSELMAAASSDFVEKASGGHSVKRRGLLSRQKSSLTFDMGAKKIEQVYYNFSKLIEEKMQTDY